MTERPRVVELGDLAISGNRDEVLIAHGLGSAVAVCAYDPAAQLAGLLTVLLPESNGTPPEGPAPFANTGVPALIWNLEDRGANIHRLVIKIAGGATVPRLDLEKGLPNVGIRNVRAVHRALARLGVHVESEDTGGMIGRTVQIAVRTGETRIWSADTMEWALQR